MKHIKKFNESNDPIVWVGALDDDYKYIPVSCELSIIYKGKDALPHFSTEEECQKWCDENTYNGPKPQLEALDQLICEIMGALKLDPDSIREADPEIFTYIGDKDNINPWNII